ncbi:hypothetical protein EDB81DRAFT_806989 [Dactylonectria macrodidyma]|uniref:Uncharacterized protein n=1 Tax=Dactylonectria macrodidyma TaxID=307937 RepID=A0A9P9E6R1_9HYPO|nr:hypothetical protein EDB81DRAFT_806989 [Dactylonectria macrodidyma]
MSSPCPVQVAYVFSIMRWRDMEIPLIVWFCLGQILAHSWRRLWRVEASTSGDRSTMTPVSQRGGKPRTAAEAQVPHRQCKQQGQRRGSADRTWPKRLTTSSTRVLRGGCTVRTRCGRVVRPPRRLLT